ncbi:MAG TPA: AMMECR1 domain-containing protein [Proteobacteria bacterium]|nr:AMMECR1 domain-containing protein [Pseudomonadota bacterium]
MRRAISCISVLVLAIAICLVACSPKGERAFSGAPSGKPKIASEDKSAALKLARAELEGKKVDVQFKGAPAGYPVIITLFKPHTKYCFGISPAGLELADAIKKAVANLKDKPCFYHYESGMDKTRIKIDLAFGERPLKNRSTKKLKYQIEPGIHGLILQKDGERFIILPEQVIYESWAQVRTTRILGNKLARKQLRKLCRQAHLDKDCWKNKELPINTFQVVSFIEVSPNGKPIDLYRGNAPVSPEPLTTERIMNAAKAAADYLIRHQKDDGSFTYIYYPTFDKEAKTYGFVRHVGTTWGFFLLYKATGEEKYKEAGIKAMKFFEKYIQFPLEAPHIAILKYKGRSAALGSMAIAALVLADAPEDVLDEKHRDLRERFGNALLFMQIDDGRFYTYFRQAVSKTIPKKQARYYPGEALLALVKLYEVTQDKKWLDAAIKSADYQVEEFWRTGRPDNWSIQALSRLYRIVKDPKYKKACYAMADWNWNHQWRKDRKPRYPDYLGGYDNARPPRSTPAASRTEAADEALKLALFEGDKEKIEQYAEAVLSAVRFDMNCQYRPENTYFLANPSRAIGGIKGSLIANDIRIDYCQHVIAAFIGATEATKYYGR